MSTTRGVKRAASKSSTSSSTATKNKKKRAIQLEIPTAPKKRGRVFTCGQGDVGQLGLGEDVIETTKFKHVTALGNKIVAASAGGMHTIALDSNGKVWTYGCNDEGALGRPTSGDKDEGTPKKVALPAKAVVITAGDSHSAALLENGDVYAWGSFRDSHGSMGLVVRGREGKPCREPVHIDIGDKAASIASGGDHLVILAISGSVYTMGCGEQGQLGRLSQRSASRDARQGFSALLVPSKVPIKGGASSIRAGYHATFVVESNQQKVFAFGLNNYGQLGITGENRKAAIYAPMECDAFGGREGAWIAISAGQHHSIALDSQGQVHTVGRCDYGRLGLGEGSSDAQQLEPVPKLTGKKCVSVSAGTSNSFAVTDTGEVYAWGMGSEGQLGTGGCADAAEPVPAVYVALQPHQPVTVAAGGQHTVLLAVDPNDKHEPSPEPESETAEEKTEESPEEEEEEKEQPRSKRQKKQEQEEEITSTSSAQPSEVPEETKPQKLNGDENKDTSMEVDEIDNKQDNKDEQTNQDKEQETEQKMETDQKEPTKPEPTKPEPTKPEQTKPEPTDTASQLASDNDLKSQEDSQDSTKTQDSEKSQDSQKSQDSLKSPDSQDSVKDVEMTETPELNGTEESEKVEAKTVESIQSAPITTSA